MAGDIRIPYDEQVGLFNPSTFGHVVHLVGVGGLGNAAAFALTKMGLATALHLYDFDTVEPKNVPCQLIYQASDIGRPKVEAAAEFLGGYRDPRLEIVPHATRVTATTPFEGIVVSAVDSMSARSAIWDAIKFNPQVVWYIDTRMGGEMLQVLSLNPSDPADVEFYEETWLFPDSDASALPCAERTIIGPPLVVAGVVATQVARIARGLPVMRNTQIHLGETQLFAYPREDNP